MSTAALLQRRCPRRRSASRPRSRRQRPPSRRFRSTGSKPATASVLAQEYAVKRWYDLDVAVEPLPFSGLEGPTHTISGTGSLAGRDGDLVDSTYAHTGDAILDDDQLNFAIVQEIENALGTANIFTTGSFDLATRVEHRPWSTAPATL